MKYLSLLIIAVLILFSCSNTNSKEATQESVVEEISVDSLRSQVLAIHDEVMPKMGELRKTRMALEALADSIVVSDSARAETLNSLASDIAAANEGMMQWMRAYEPEFEGTDEEIETYLNEQKIAVAKVRDDMNESLESGKEALGN